MEQSRTVGFYNKSLERALQILSAYSNERQTFTLVQLSATLGLSKATTKRLCTTLVKYDFLQFDDSAKRYSLGLKLFELGSIVFASFSLRRIASPFLINLHTKLDKTVFLGILQRGELVYFDKKENPLNPIRFGSHTGMRRQPYFGMLGNTLMAHLPDEKVDALLQTHPLAALTKKTITDEKLLKERFGIIRSQGYYVDAGEAIEGVTGVAAPIRDFNKQVVASIGVGFISSSENATGLKRIIRETVRTASAVSQAMGYVEEAGKQDSQASMKR